MVDKHPTREYRSWISLFQPDVLAPLQYLDLWRCKHRQLPEMRLMLAVLEDGIGCYQRFATSKSRRARLEFREAERWLMGRRDDGFYSFNHICAVLGLDPDYLRVGLRRWRQGRAGHCIGD